MILIPLSMYPAVAMKMYLFLCLYIILKFHIIKSLFCIPESLKNFNPTCNFD